MIDINLIRSNPDAVKASLKKKECDVDFSELLSWDAERRALISDVESLKARKNKVSADIPRLKKEGKLVDAIFDEMRKIGEEISEDDKKIDDLQEKIFNFVACLPNLPDDDLVAGGKENNAVQKVIGKMPEFDFEPKNQPLHKFESYRLRTRRETVGRRILDVPRRRRTAGMGASEFLYFGAPERRLRIYSSAVAARL